MDGRENWIRFQQVFGCGTTRGQKILTHFGHPDGVFARTREELAQLGILTPAELRRIQDAVTEDRAAQILDFCEDYGCTVLTPEDPSYPRLLREIYAFPQVLYVMGSLEGLEDELAIAMVGTRHCTEYGKRAAEAIAGELAAKGAAIISGLAKGIDAVSHAAALRAGGRTIAVQGCGIDVTYPLENARLKESIIHCGGAVVTEFPPGEAPRPYHFPVRNRIISGLSNGIVVVEGTRSSGSLITAGHAFTQNRDVFAVPGSIFSKASQGPNYLIRQGAKAVDNVESILEEYRYLIRWELPGGEPPPEQKTLFEEFDKSGYNEEQRLEETGAISPKGKKAVSVQQPLPAYLNDVQQKIFSALSDGEILTSDVISQQCGLPVQAVLAALTQLEIFGLVKTHPGRRFSL
jgi:DNA processing protein